MNLVDGCVQAKNVTPGSAMWTLDGDRTVRTTVVDVTAVKARTAVDVVTDHMTFTASPDLLLCTPDGWVPATDTVGKTVAWTPARKLCRERLTIKPGYEFGYFVGATCADGTVGKNYVSLIVNEERFAARYAAALTACTGLPARLEAVTRPSGYLKRDLPGFRVRVVSSYLSDAYCGITWVGTPITCDRAFHEQSSGTPIPSRAFWTDTSRAMAATSSTVGAA
ncbi:hypothetical protein [Streptomyces sp. S1]|uniref:hypothetical protein n=1 Tax=Streptomyces sp. S1 TaxID=718288 RepID=UPI001F097697|nr:hypothetical protein [Streptomyces sp. S1]